MTYDNANIKALKGLVKFYRTKKNHKDVQLLFKNGFGNRESCTVCKPLNLPHMYGAHTQCSMCFWGNSNTAENAAVCIKQRTYERLEVLADLLKIKSMDIDYKGLYVKYAKAMMARADFIERKLIKAGLL